MMVSLVVFLALRPFSSTATGAHTRKQQQHHVVLLLLLLFVLLEANMPLALCASTVALLRHCIMPAIVPNTLDLTLPPTMATHRRTYGPKSFHYVDAEN